MAVIPLAEPTAADQQKEVYNSNVGGNLNRWTSYTVPADTSWVAVGCVLADGTTQETLTNTIIPAVVALAEVTSVEGDVFYGLTPATIHDAGYELILNISGDLGMLLGTEADNFSQTQHSHAMMKLAKNKVWSVLLCYVPLPMTALRVTALQTAMETVPGITRAEHLIDGTVPTRCYGSGALRLAAHLRLERIEE